MEPIPSDFQHREEVDIITSKKQALQISAIQN